MFYFVISWIVLLVACSVIGTGVLHGITQQPFQRLGDRWVMSLWLGLVVLSVGLLALSLILPLSPVLGLASAALGCALSLSARPVRQDLVAFWQSLSPARVTVGLAVAVAVAALTSAEVTWVDTGLYHYGMVRWLTEYGTVPGLALMFENLGFTSAWFALAAPLSIDRFAAHTSAITNGFVYLLAAWHLLVCGNHLLKGKANLGDWFMAVFLVLFLPLLFLFPPMPIILISPSPDIPAALLVGVTAWAMLAIMLQPEGRDPEGGRVNALILPLILSTSAVSFKLIALPLWTATVIWFLVSNLGNRNKFRSLFIAAIVVGVLLLPLLMGNTLTSGCPLYPSTKFCFDLPWSPVKKVAQSVADDTHHWMSWYGTPPAGANPWLWALGRWFNDGRDKQVMAVLMGVSVGLSCYVAITSLRYRDYKSLWLILITASGLIFFMLTAPFPRFALPYLFLMPALSIALYSIQRWEPWLGQLESRLDRPPWQKRMLLLPYFLAVLITVVSLRGDGFRLLLPPALKTVTVDQTRINDVVYWLPRQEELCWSTALPCAYGVLNDIVLRVPEEGIGGGFVHRVK